jgi:hypothetical protein
MWVRLVLFLSNSLIFPRAARDGKVGEMAFERPHDAASGN